jgi:hypothetical protein
MRIALASFAFLIAAHAQAGDGTFEVVAASATGSVGTPVLAKVTIKAKQGWHLNHEAPLTLKLSPLPGVAFDKPKLVRKDLAFASETEARFDVGLTLSAPGKKEVEAEAGFVLCREDACRPIKEKVVLAAEAAAEKVAPSNKKGKKR